MDAAALGEAFDDIRNVVGRDTYLDLLNDNPPAVADALLAYAAAQEQDQQKEHPNGE